MPVIVKLWETVGAGSRWIYSTVQYCTTLEMMRLDNKCRYSRWRSTDRTEKGHDWKSVSRGAINPPILFDDGVTHRNGSDLIGPDCLA
jgi:hypothetical protein